MSPNYLSKNQKENNNGEKPNHLDDMEERLYSRNKNGNGGDTSKRNVFPSRLGDFGGVNDVRSEWNESGGRRKERVTESVSTRNTFSFLKQILIGSIVLFLVSVGIAAYVFLGNHNIVSTKNILININTPTTVGGGEILPVEISVSNQNNVSLVSADIVVEYPDGTRQSDDLSKTLTRYRESVGPIGVGQTINKKYNVVFFGEEGESKDITVSLEYRVDNSNAIFTTSATRTVRLSSAPVSVSVDAPAEASPGQDTVFAVTVVANSSQTVQHLIMTADYPFGFTMSGSDPKPTGNNNIWDLGDLKPGVTRVIKITGQFSGNEGEQPSLRFSVGSPDPNDGRKIGVVFLSKTSTVTLAKPFIGLDLVLGGSDDPEYVTAVGSPIRADIVFTNNLPTKITNVSIQAKFNGSIYDRNSVSVSSGFFRSLDNTVIWDQTTKSQLAELQPGQSGTVSFSFNTLPGALTLLSPSMSINVSATGNTTNQSSANQQVNVTTSKIIKIASQLGLTAKVLYSSGPFQNSGPIPPKSDQETTYTVVLSLTNTSNDLSNVEVVTSIPIYDGWLNKVSPESENIKYNPVGGGITWDVGDLKAGGGPREASFQISFTPSVNQIGQYPLILNNVSASGYDSFSGVTVNAQNVGALDISMPSDSAYANRAGPVGQ